MSWKTEEYQFYVIENSNKQLVIEDEDKVFEWASTKVGTIADAHHFTKEEASRVLKDPARHKLKVKPGEVLTPWAVTGTFIVKSAEDEFVEDEIKAARGKLTAREIRLLGIDED